MIRNVGALEGPDFDLIVIGGGIFGASTAREAAARGLSVALIERADFCAHTSAHSFKLVHGGIRYLQHADIRRVRQSSASRRTFLRVAPHLARPLPVVVPTYGHGMRGREVLRVGTALYDLVTWDRNRGIQDPARRISGGRSMSKEEVRSSYPGLASSGLTGAGVFDDGQMLNPPRLVWAFTSGAMKLGAVAANYVEATGVLSEGGRIRGVLARDVLGGGRLVVRGRAVVNATGPYAEAFLSRIGVELRPSTPWSRDAYFVVGRPLVPGEAALALPASTRDPDALVSRGARHLFLVPWRERTLVGVWHRVYVGEPDAFRLEEQELEAFLAEINAAYGGLGLTRDDISLCNSGLIPFGENDPNARNLRFGHASRVVNHGDGDGFDGLWTLIGARFTTAPQDAARVVDQVVARAGRTAPGSRSEEIPLPGGNFESFEALVAEVQRRAPASLRPRDVQALAQNHGSEYARVLEIARARPELAETFSELPVLKAEAVRAIREELAQTLADVVLRRTELGTGEYPGRAALEECASVVGAELGWSELRRERELASVLEAYPSWIRERVDAAAGVRLAEAGVAREGAR